MAASHSLPIAPHLQRLRALGLTAERFASLTGVHAVTVRGWGKPRSGRCVQPVPLWVWLLIEAWERCPGLIPVPLAEIQTTCR